MYIDLNDHIFNTNIFLNVLKKTEVMSIEEISQDQIEIPQEDQLNKDQIENKKDQFPSPMKFDLENTTENSSMLLDISVSPTDLESLWAELGLRPSEVEQEKNKLNRLINEVKYKAEKEASVEKLAIVNEIRQIKDRHIRFLTALGGSDTECDLVEHSGYEGTLRQRLNEVKSNFEIFEPKCKELIHEFEQLKEKTDELFDKIGYSIEDRGEFAQIGDNDLSRERQARFRDKIAELEEEVQQREKEFEKLKEKVTSIATKLGSNISPRVKTLFDTNDISTNSFEVINEYLEDLSIIRNSRVAQASELALAISYEWELLDIPENERESFIDSHSQLTERCIQGFSDELIRLRNVRNQKLPELIERVKKDILEVCHTLHYTKSEIDSVFAKIKEVPNDNLATFSAYESELIDLKRILIISQPIIDLIHQRENMIKDYEELEKKEKTKDGRNDKIDQKKERIKRRYKYVLPRVEKRILLTALEFKQINGIDIFWDGVKVEDMCQNVTLTPAELAQFSDGRRKTLNPQKLMNLISSSANRANRNMAFDFD